MLPLKHLDALLEAKGALEIEQMNEVIKENSHDGYVLRMAAENGYCNVVKFILTASDRLSLSSEEMITCFNEGSKDSHKNSPLHLAAANGHTAVVECLLRSRGTLINEENEYQESPLFLACKMGHDDVVSILIKYGACLAGSDTDPMDVAASGGHVRIVKRLLESGAPMGCALVNAAEQGHKDIVCLLTEHILDQCWSSFELSSALRVAIENGHEHVCEVLLHSNIDLFLSDHEGKSFLALAAGTGHVGILQLLLSSGVDINFVEDETTPLHEASRSGHVNILEILLNLNMNVNHVNQLNETPLDIALERGHTKSVILLYSYGAVFKTKEFYLKLAAKQGRFLAMCCLFSMGANPSEQDAGDMLHDACSKNAIEIAQLLVKKSACINALNEAYDSPLHIACRQNCGERLVEFLLKSNADPHLINEEGSTALHVVCNKQSARLLLQSDVLVDARDARGQTPLYYACDRAHWDVAELLIEHGASVNSQGSNGVRILFVCLDHIFWERLEIDCDHCGYSLSDCECNFRPRSVEIMELLLKEGADVNITNYEGTPLHIAVISDALEVVKLLLTYGADVNAVDMEGRRALHVCTSTEVAELLLESGADPMCQDIYGDTPLCAAKRCERRVVAAFMEMYF